MVMEIQHLSEKKVWSAFIVEVTGIFGFPESFQSFVRLPFLFASFFQLLHLIGSLFFPTLDFFDVGS